MNIYKNLLFLGGHVLDPKLLADTDTDTDKGYAERYGNRVASRRALQPLGHTRDRQPEPTPAVAEQSCVAGGCG